MDKPKVVKSHDIHLDSEYATWIHEIKERYRNTQIKAAVKVNSEQLLFNWMLGRDLVMRKAEEKWGSGIVEQVSLDLQNEFPNVKGFSARNLWNMKKWFLFYSSFSNFEDEIKLITEAMEVPNVKLHQLGAELQEIEKLHQTGAELLFPYIFSFVPWRHHCEIITKCKDVKEALFYVQRTIKEGWSRSALINAIEADLFHKAGGAITNFEQHLEISQSKLAKEITKETYDLGFITLPPEYDETDLEDALPSVEDIQRRIELAEIEFKLNKKQGS